MIAWFILGAIGFPLEAAGCLLLWRGTRVSAIWFRNGILNGILELIWSAGVVCLAVDLAFGRRSENHWFGVGLAVATGVAFLAWLWRRKRWDRAVRAIGATARARITAMTDRMRELGSPTPEGNPA